MPALQTILKTPKSYLRNWFYSFIEMQIQDVRSKAGEFEVFSLSNNKAYYNVYERYTKLSSMMENDREFRSRYTLTGTPGIWFRRHCNFLVSILTLFFVSFCILG